MNITQQPDITNRMRKLLNTAGRPLLGIWSMLNSTNVTEGLAWSGFDWLLIDGEHAAIELPQVIHHLRILDSTPTASIVRLAWNDPLLIKRHLDAGVTSFMLPFVQSADEAKSAVNQMRYPPRGERGMALMHRASRYASVKNYFTTAEESLFLIVQIENKKGLKNMDEILLVDGVDAVFFGPSDLSASLGAPGEASGEMVTSVIVDALSRVRASGKFAGALAASPQQADIFLNAGFDFVSVAIDCGLLFNGARNTAKQYMDQVKKISTDTK